MPQAANTFAQHWLQEYGDKLYAYALGRVGGNAALAEDLLQETLLAGISGYTGFERKSSTETWLFGILRRKIVDHYRKQERKGREISLDEFFSDTGSIKHLGDWKFDAEHLVENHEFLRVMKTCMDNLTTPFLEAFTFAVIDGLTTEETCKLLGITPTNLSVRLHRARLSLRRCLETKWFEEI